MDATLALSCRSSFDSASFRARSVTGRGSETGGPEQAAAASTIVLSTVLLIVILLKARTPLKSLEVVREVTAMAYHNRSNYCNHGGYVERGT
jgi:hypothetical protein